MKLADTVSHVIGAFALLQYEISVGVLGRHTRALGTFPIRISKLASFAAVWE